MPLYEFYCDNCKIEFDELFKRGNMPSCSPCPNCGESAGRRISVFSFQFSQAFLEKADPEKIGDRIFFDGKRPSMRDSFKKEIGLIK